MKMRRLGRNGPMVSAIGLGCMGMTPIYGTPDDAEVTARLLQRRHDKVLEDAACGDARGEALGLVGTTLADIDVGGDELRQLDGLDHGKSPLLLSIRHSCRTPAPSPLLSLAPTALERDMFLARSVLPRGRSGL